LEKRLNAEDVCVNMLNETIQVQTGPIEKNYFDLTKDSLDDLVISENDYKNNCFITNKTSDTFYDGFTLSNLDKVQTKCDVEFHPSSLSGKYVPRLVFRKILKSSGRTRETKNNLVRISFRVKTEGYKEFWLMINFLKKFKDLVDTGEFDNSYHAISDQDFAEYLNYKNSDSDIRGLIDTMGRAELSSVELVQSASIIKLLEEYKEKLKEFIEQKVNEKVVQNWLDEDEHIHRSKRCLIFGLEFIKHYREGGASGNRYDLLTRIGIGSRERVLIELKSPEDDIFEEKENPTINEVKKDYSLSGSLSRAIPQILEYKRTMENKKAGDVELEKVGEEEEIKIAKSIIVIGSYKDNSRWTENLRDLRKSLSSNLEIWTYTDLLNKIESTISNLKQEFEK
jgi:hypothetical protein